MSTDQEEEPHVLSDEERAQRILRRAKLETGTRDIVTLGGVRMWLALLGVVSLFVAFFGKAAGDDLPDSSKSNERRRRGGKTA